MKRAVVIAGASVLLVSAPSVPATDRGGTWRDSDPGTDGAHGVTEVRLVQRGGRVTGHYVEDGTAGERWEGCVKGQVRNVRATVRVGFTNQRGPGTSIPACPDHGPADDPFVLARGKLLWFNRGTNGGGKPCKTLLPVASDTGAPADGCLSCKRAPDSSRDPARRAIRRSSPANAPDDPGAARERDRRCRANRPRPAQSAANGPPRCRPGCSAKESLCCDGWNGRHWRVRVRCSRRRC